jgi:membrane protein implicated in regulation of membrane protease activity
MEHLAFWSWWIVAGVLLVLELLSLTFYLLWIAIGALITGGVKFFMPDLALEWQFVVFAVWSVLSAYLWYRYNKSRPLTQEQQTLNRRASQYIGQTVTLETPIINGQGKARVGDSLWLVVGATDLPAGSKVKVIGEEGAALKVQ